MSGMTIALAEANPARRVAYVPQGGALAELGIITGVSERFVFVRYDGYAVSKATDPADLRLVVQK